MRVFISQSNYIPWKGYFRSLIEADQVIFLDDVQFTKRDWRNRNKIKTSNGIKWLTIPVETSGKYFQKIQDVLISDENWHHKHLNSLHDAYKESPFFDEIYDLLRNHLDLNRSQYLSEVNIGLIKVICEYLGVELSIRMSREFTMLDNPSERLLSICKSLNAEVYMSGSAAKNYLATGLFKEMNIEVQWIDYTGFSEYDQLYPPFVHEVSIIDVLFMLGKQSISMLK